MEQNAGQAEARINNLVLLYKFQFGYHKSDSYASILSRSREWSISLRVSVILRVFAPAVDPPYYGVFGGKCTTVFGAINMLNAFARVEAGSLFAPTGEVCNAGSRVGAKKKGEEAARREERRTEGEEEREGSIRRQKWVGRTLEAGRERRGQEE